MNIYHTCFFECLDNRPLPETIIARFTDEYIWFIVGAILRILNDIVMGYLNVTSFSVFNRFGPNLVCQLGVPEEDRPPPLKKISDSKWSQRLKATMTR